MVLSFSLVDPGVLPVRRTSRREIDVLQFEIACVRNFQLLEMNFFGPGRLLSVI